MPELSEPHENTAEIGVRHADDADRNSLGSGADGAPESPEPSKLSEEGTGVSPPQERPTERAGDEGPSAKRPVERESWAETVKTIVYALLIALVIRTFLFQPFNIPSGSMENTLLIGDYLFVEKFAYGYSKHSLPFSTWFPVNLLPSGRLLAAQPQRGDVIVFKMPDPNSKDYMKDFIKRVIGLPGDRIQMIDGQLYINDKPCAKVFVGNDVETDELGAQFPAKRYRETLPNGKTHYILSLLDRFRKAGDNTQVYTVPPGHYFMMGDNRDNSADSRLEVGGFGFVPAEDLEGKAEFIFFSADGSVAQWWEFWKWPWAIRFSRMFTLID